MATKPKRNNVAKCPECKEIVPIFFIPGTVTVQCPECLRRERNALARRIEILEGYVEYQEREISTLKG